jgi:hypothetical protein
MISKFAIATIFFAFFGFSVAAEQSIAALLKPVENLTSQDTRPFLFSGFDMTPESPRWHQFRKPIARFDDARPCLMKEERSKPVVDLTKIDWKNLKSLPEQQVCIFRIMTTLDDPEAAAVWLKENGFLVTKLRRTRPPPEPWEKKPNKPRHELTGQWSQEQYRDAWPSLFAKITGLDQIRFYLVQVQFSEDFRVVGVAVSANTK